MVQVLYLLEVFILAHYGPPSTETPTTETTIVWCHKNSWIYLTSTYCWWLLRPIITIRFDSKFQAQLFDSIQNEKHYSHSTSDKYSGSRVQSVYMMLQAEKSNKRHRPIGLGVQGLADTFLTMRFPFESEEAQRLNRDIFETIYYSALKASCELARLYGPYETYEGSPVSHGVSIVVTLNYFRIFKDANKVVLLLLLLQCSVFM